MGWQVLPSDESFTVKDGSVLLTREHIDDILERLSSYLARRSQRGPPLALPPPPAASARPPKAVPYSLPRIRLGFELPPPAGLGWCDVGQWKATCWAPGACTAIWPPTLVRPDPQCPIVLEGR